MPLKRKLEKFVNPIFTHILNVRSSNLSKPMSVPAYTHPSVPGALNFPYIFPTALLASPSVFFISSISPFVPHTLFLLPPCVSSCGAGSSDQVPVH